MAKRGIIPSEDAFGRIRATVKHYERTQPTRKARRMPRRRALGGGSCSCVTVHEIRYEGAVTSGTVSFSVAIWTDDVPTVDTDTLVLNWDDTAAEVQTTWETHSGIAASGADILVIGGPLPSVAVYIVFKSTGALNRHHPLPIPTSSLVGTNARCKVAYMGDANWEGEA